MRDPSRGTVSFTMMRGGLCGGAAQRRRRLRLVKWWALEGEVVQETLMASREVRLRMELGSQSRGG